MYAIGNRQKKAKAMIEASGLKMIAVEDFDLAARTVYTLLAKHSFPFVKIVHVDIGLTHCVCASCLMHANMCSV